MTRAHGCYSMAAMMRFGRALAITAAVTIATGSLGSTASCRELDRARAEGLVARFLKLKAAEWPAHDVALSVAMVADGELVLAQATGDERPGIPATVETRYKIGSIAKQMTAAVVLDLIEKGAGRAGAESETVGLDTPITSIIEGAREWSPKEGPPITIRRLLTMTSNLPSFTRRPPKGTNPWGSVGAPELLGALKRLPPTGWPNTFEYSNTNYFLLAEIIDRLVDSGETVPKGHAASMRSLFSRVGMSRTDLAGAVPEGGLATPHYHRKPAFAEPDWLKGSADVVSTVIDLQRWNKALMEHRVLSPTMRHEMFADAARVGPVQWYGMGWFISHPEGRDEYLHTGTVPGYTAVNLIVQTKDRLHWCSVSIMTNIDGVDALDELATDLADLTFD